MSYIQEGKSISISTMRVLAMFMIIAFHSMLFYTGKWWKFSDSIVPLWVNASEFLNTIDLPMFVFISGFLFCHLYIKKNKYRNKPLFILGKVKRLVVPYLFWGLFLIIAMPSLNQWENLLTGISHLWFLLMLFNIFAIAIFLAPFLCAVKSKTRWGVCFFGAIFIFLAFHTYSTHHHFLCLHSVFFYLPAFLLGMCFAMFNLHDCIPAKYACILLIVCLFILAIYVSQFTQSPYFIDYGIKLLLGYTIVACTFILFNKTLHLKEKSITIISHFDKLSMGIYIFNQITINTFLLMPGTTSFLKEHHIIGVPIIFVVGFVIPWFLSMLFNRFRYLKWTIG